MNTFSEVKHVIHLSLLSWKPKLQSLENYIHHIRDI